MESLLPSDPREAASPLPHLQSSQPPPNLLSTLLPYRPIFSLSSQEKRNFSDKPTFFLVPLHIHTHTPELLTRASGPKDTSLAAEGQKDVWMVDNLLSVKKKAEDGPAWPQPRPSVGLSSLSG